MKESRRLYTDLAWLWPLWGDASAEYADYSARVSSLIRRCARRPVERLLDIGCGGGKNVFNLKRDFQVTGLDLSAAMLAQARELNPDCRFVHGDMRSFSLDQRFDAVLMDDAISYMNTRSDFAAAFQAAHAHLRPGGVMVVTPDVTVENFQQNRTSTYSARRGDLDVVFVENVHDPDPGDEHYETTVLYLIRERGELRIETDHWRLGLYSLPTWREVLRAAGFQVFEEACRLDGDDYTVFACLKPE